MPQSAGGVNNTYNLGNGITPHYQITYDDTAFPEATDPADGVDKANALMAVCESDFSLMQGWFPGVDISTNWSFPIAVYITPFVSGTSGRPYGGHWGPPITLTTPSGASTDFIRYLLVSEVTEMFMETKHNNWGYWVGNIYVDEGSDGEGLSRFLGVQCLIWNNLSFSVLNNPAPGETWWASNSWLGSARADYINNNPNPSDNADDSTTGCTTLFIWYLYTQLGFEITEIINAGAPTLTGTYNALTGDLGNPVPFFERLVGTTYPGTDTIPQGSNNADNPFPLGILSFWGVRSTFGLNEVQDIITTNSGLVSNAFTLVLEGFSIDSFSSLNVTIPTLTGSLVAQGTGIQVSPSPAVLGEPTPSSPIPQFEDPANTKAPQRISFSFDITFSNTNAFPSVGSTTPNSLELDALAQFGGTNLPGASAVQPFELFGGDDPYFSNHDPTNAGQKGYLSQELRVFPVIPGKSPLQGAPAFTSDPFASIQSLLNYLNSNSSFTTPTTPDPLNGLPGQQNDETVDSAVTPIDANGNKNYNFAIARVRLSGSSSEPAANNVRVFFRLWVAQSCDTDWQPNSGPYKSILGTSGDDSGNPVFPQASDTGLFDPTGQTLQTVPFFATDTLGTHDYDGSNPNANIHNIQISSDDGIWTYYGCFLDVYDANNNAKWGGTHHCVVVSNLKKLHSANSWY